MLLPTQLKPEQFGLAWNMSPLHCLWRLKSIRLRRTAEGLTVRIRVGDEQSRVNLHFDEQGLGCISVITHVSQEVLGNTEEDWEDADSEDVEEYEVVEGEFESIYSDAVAATSEIIGMPDFAQEDLEGEYGVFTDLQGARYYDAEENVFDGLHPHDRWLGGSELKYLLGA